jgi:hypothetical protein
MKTDASGDASPFRVVGWQTVPESPFAQNQWTVKRGTMMPDWAWNALVKGDVIPWPPAVKGDFDWGADGVRVANGGQHFPIGSVLRREDVYPK